MRTEKTINAQSKIFITKATKWKEEKRHSIHISFHETVFYVSAETQECIVFIN